MLKHRSLVFIPLVFSVFSLSGYADNYIKCISTSYATDGMSTTVELVQNSNGTLDLLETHTGGVAGVYYTVALAENFSCIQDGLVANCMSDDSSRALVSFELSKNKTINFVTKKAEWSWPFVNVKVNKYNIETSLYDRKTLEFNSNSCTYNQS